MAELLITTPSVWHYPAIQRLRYRMFDRREGGRGGRLALESGAFFEGSLFGSTQERPVSGEAIFNTCMTGYQEVVTDPSYAGQIVVMTYPLIGNYGCRDTVRESNQVWCRGVV